MIKNVIVTGGSKGIGKAIALKFASYKGHIIVISNDSDDSVIQEIENKGATGTFIHSGMSDLRTIEKSLQGLDKLDILVNNTSATYFKNILELEVADFDKMIETSVRSAIFMAKLAHPYLIKSLNPHIINISPPLDLREKWFKDFSPFTIAKYSMSLSTLALSSEFKDISVNSLWPKTPIATQTIKNHFMNEVFEASRWPGIMADSTAVLSEKTNYTGHFCLDEDLLLESGVSDFSKYAVNQEHTLMQSLFVPDFPHLTPIKKEYFL